MVRQKGGQSMKDVGIKAKVPFRVAIEDVWLANSRLLRLLLHVKWRFCKWISLSSQAWRVARKQFMWIWRTLCSMWSGGLWPRSMSKKWYLRFDDVVPWAVVVLKSTSILKLMIWTRRFALPSPCGRPLDKTFETVASNIASIGRSDSWFLRRPFASSCANLVVILHLPSYLLFFLCWECGIFKLTSPLTRPSQCLILCFGYPSTWLCFVKREIYNGASFLEGVSFLCWDPNG
jgi:hypothetical protein